MRAHHRGSSRAGTLCGLLVGLATTGWAEASTWPRQDPYAESLEHTQARRFAEALESAAEVPWPIFRGQAELYALFTARDYLGGIEAAARTLDGRLDDLNQLEEGGQRAALYLMQSAAEAALVPYGDAEGVEAWCDALEGALETFGLEGEDRAEKDALLGDLRSGAEARRASNERRGEALARAQGTLAWGMGGLVVLLLIVGLLPAGARKTLG